MRTLKPDLRVRMDEDARQTIERWAWEIERWVDGVADEIEDLLERIDEEERS